MSRIDDCLAAMDSVRADGARLRRRVDAMRRLAHDYLDELFDAQSATTAGLRSMERHR